MGTNLLNDPEFNAVDSWSSGTFGIQIVSSSWRESKLCSGLAGSGLYVFGGSGFDGQNGRIQVFQELQSGLLTGKTYHAKYFAKILNFEDPTLAFEEARLMMVDENG